MRITVIRRFSRKVLPILTFVVLVLSGCQCAQAQLLTGFSNPAEIPEPASSVTTASLSVPAFETSPERVPERAPESEPSAASPGDAPVDLQADKLEHDQESDIITASGDVMLVQSGRIFRADKIAYNLRDDRVVATGHVVLNEENGDIHYADEVELKNEFKDGFVKELKTTMNDGSRFMAHNGTRRDGKVTTMEDATYTPCEPCKANPEKPPAWQIRASEVVHDQNEHSISYKNARFEALGVPVMYTPYFSHPDGTIKRKSGLLPPSFGFKSNLGLFATSSYYWDVSPDKDATFGVMAMTEEVPLFLGEWRQRWEEASLMLSGGITSSGRTDSVANVNVDKDEEVRGHVKAEGEWHMNEKWRSGLNINWASDDQYMRQYDLDSEDVLENEIYAERFSGRNYTVGRLLAFQDIRVGDNQVEQPQVLPELITSFIGEPGEVPVLGGRWDATASFLGLRRDGSNQDMNRLSLDGGWQRRLVSDYGFLTTFDTSIRADFYNTRDRDVAPTGSGRDQDVFGARFYPQVDAQVSYPMVRQFETMQAVIQPVASITIAPNLDTNDRIPNEDSQDVQLDASNIFEPNRFPGLDRVEDRSRVTYGMRAGLYTHKGNSGDVFLGQSYRFDDDDNPFPQGSGLDKQESDVVGQVSASVGGDYNLSYRFQLSSQDLSSERHEVDTNAVLWDRLHLNANYLYANALEGTGIDDSREQLLTDVGLYLNEDWQMRVGARNDFGVDRGLREAYFGLDYFGQCVSWSFVGKKNYTDDSSGESDTEILFTVGLRNLSEFAESDLRRRRAAEYASNK